MQRLSQPVDAMQRALFCPPTYYEIRDVKNPFMQNATPVDRDLARSQWDEVRRAFEAAGFATATIEAIPDLEDMVFANNQVFVGPHTDGPFIVPSRMRFASRQREVPYFVEWFRERGYRVFELDFGEEFLEGHGDLLWNADYSCVWAGHGIRSSRGGVEKFSRAMAHMGIEVVPLELVDARFYHLDTCLAPLTAEAVLVYPGAFTGEALEDIHSRTPRVYEVGTEDALQFVCNGVVAGGRFITAQLTPRLAQALALEGLQPIKVETSEFEKSGGSVCCLKLFLE
jgi:N-dimethylarginine dimethylaminohydrolase